MLLVGCGGSAGVEPGSRVSIYVSAPLRGPAAELGRDLVRGAKLALADYGGELAVRAVYLDSTEGPAATSRWTPARAAANARAATEDSGAIAYVGDFSSGATRASLPITNQARLLQVSPASGAVGLVAPFRGSDVVPEELQHTGERTFGRVIPADDVAARTARAWSRSMGGTGVGVLDPETGLADLPRSGTEHAVSAAQDPSQLPATARRFLADYRREHGAEPGRYAAYGYEAVAVILDSIERAGDRGTDRGAVIEEFFATAERRSVLGTYSIDELGETTLDRLAGYRIGAGGLTFVRALHARAL